MKRDVIRNAAIAAGAAALAFASVLYLGTRPVESVGEEPILTATKALPSAPAKVRKDVKRILPQGTAAIRPSPVKVDPLTNGTGRAAADADEALLNKVVEELLNELSEAVAGGNSKRILELVARLKALDFGAGSSRYGRGGGSVALKRRVLDALAEVGPPGVAQVIAFLGDSEPVIVQSATDLLFKNLQDISLGDRVRAEIVVAAAEEMTDENNVIRLYQEFIKMRHSVGAEALVSISKSGSDAAKAQLPRTISAFTRDLSITEASQLSAWLAENPDSNRDDWFYGPRGETPLEK